MIAGSASELPPDAVSVDAGGKMMRSGKFFPIAAESQPAAAANWPAGFQVTVPIDTNVGGRRERPFVVVWIENDKGVPIRTLEIWGGLGKDSKYLKDLRTFWKWAQREPEMIRSVTRASRMPGKYALVWDGKDQKGNAVPAGTYTIWLEVGSEHGGRAANSAEILCNKESATVTIPKTSAFNASAVTYGPKEKAK
jgi:hypothetical protein